MEKDNVKDNNLIKIESPTISNNYYEKNQESRFYNQQINTRDQSSPEKISNMIDYVLSILHIRENINKIFGLEKLIEYILISIKIWLKNNFPETNSIFFKEKTASLNLSYTQYLAGYYTSQNNDADYLTYKSILNYTIEKKCTQISYLLNQSGEITYFDNNTDIKINNYIYITTKTVTSNTTILYNIEIYSYNIKLDKIHKFIKYCVDKYKQKTITLNLIVPGAPTQKYYRYIGLNNTAQATYEDYKFQSNKTFDNIFFSNKNTFLKKINFFNDNRKAYSDLGIPYSLGIIFYGCPGTGKTSCIKALANYCNRHIVDINFGKIKQNKELRAIFYDPKINGLEVPQQRRMYVFEEFDCIIETLKERNIKYLTSNNISQTGIIDNSQNYSQNNQSINNVQPVGNIGYASMMSRGPMQNGNSTEQDSPVSLDSLLNLLDGCIEHHGPIFIITTNHINKIDKALIRPGRFDIHLHLDNSTSEIIVDMIKHFYNKKYRPIISLSISDEQFDRINKISTFEDKYIWSPAKITQICLTYIDSTDYVDSIIKHMEDNYDKEKALIDIFYNSNI